MISAFEYKIRGAGWAELNIAAGEERVSMNMSYMEDSIVYLINSLVRLLNQESKFEMILFDGETWEHSLLLTQIKSGVLRIEIISGAYFDNFEPDNNVVPKPTLYTYENLIDFYWLVYSELNKMKKNLGEYFYKELWWNEFPSKELDMLFSTYKSIYLK